MVTRGGTLHYANVMTSEHIDASHFPQILDVDEYKNEKIFVKSALETYFEQNGLTDFQEFMLRAQIQYHFFCLGYLEVTTHENTRQWFTGMTHTGTSVRNTKILWQNHLGASDQWKVLTNQWEKYGPQELLQIAWNSYINVNKLWKEEKFQEAGQYMILNIFPEKLPKVDTTPACQWHYGTANLPYIYENYWEGQQVNEEIAGLIYRFLGEQNFDHLSKCVQYRDYFSKNLHDSYVIFQQRNNEDVIQGLGRMAATLQGMDEHVRNCNSQTKKQVKAIEERVNAIVPLDDVKILKSIQKNKRHIEIYMAKVELQYLINDWMEYGESLAELFLTIVEP